MKAAKINVLHQKNWDVFNLTVPYTEPTGRVMTKGWYVQAYNRHRIYEGEAYGPFDSKVAAVFWLVGQK